MKKKINFYSRPRHRSIVKILILINISWILTVTIYQGKSTTSTTTTKKQPDVDDGNLIERGKLKESGKLIGSGAGKEQQKTTTFSAIKLLTDNVQFIEHALDEESFTIADTIDVVISAINQSTLHITPVDPWTPPGTVGEMGETVNLPQNLTKDMISVRRLLPDDWCTQPNLYLANLPKTDIVICFHNEAWSMLLRTVHSLLGRSPPQLINKIILVDDFSSMEHTKQPLDEYFANYPKVQIIRAKRREGPIKARLLGARHATAPVLTFLDSHCECTEGWLEPLLDRIARNSTTVVYPNIFTITAGKFDQQVSDLLIGGFTWNLEFKAIPIPEREWAEERHLMAPIHSPTMPPSGIFAISRTYFEYLGTYDDGFESWGAENFELSFKTWMCGGTLEMIPCSHVGQIFSSEKPNNSMWGEMDGRNFDRLADVWMDNYAAFYYENNQFCKSNYADDLERKMWRRQLNCKSFKWYLENVYPEMPIPLNLRSAGEIKLAEVFENICLDTGTQLGGPVTLWACHGELGNQYWTMTAKGEIRHGDNCLDYSGEEVIIAPCHGQFKGQSWLYDPYVGVLVHKESDLCLAMSIGDKKVILENCDPRDSLQIWSVENFDYE